MSIILGGGIRENIKIIFDLWHHHDQDDDDDGSERNHFGNWHHGH